MVLADRVDSLLWHAETAGAAGLRPPDVDRLEFARHRHCRQYAHAHVERALEADIGAEMGKAPGQLRRMQEHRERSLHRAAARDNRVEDRLVLGRNLVLAGDRLEPCHRAILSQSPSKIASGNNAEIFFFKQKTAYEIRRSTATEQMT